MISIKNVSFSYGENKIYDDFSLDIAEGSVTCALGESGCGKTTLIRMIASLVAYEGKIECDKKISCVFQEPMLLPNLTVKGNLSLVTNDCGRIASALKAISLGDKSDYYPYQLSLGEKQRVSLVRAFLYGGKTFLLDEPFSSLGLKLKNELISLFSELFHSDKDRTALFVTHSVREAVAVGDRIIIIKNGKITADIKNIPSKNCIQYTSQTEYIEKILMD